MDRDTDKFTDTTDRQNVRAQTCVCVCVCVCVTVTVTDHGPENNKRATKTNNTEKNPKQVKQRTEKNVEN